MVFRLDKCSSTSCFVRFCLTVRYHRWVKQMTALICVDILAVYVERLCGRVNAVSSSTIPPSRAVKLTFGELYFRVP